MPAAVVTAVLRVLDGASADGHSMLTPQLWRRDMSSLLQTPRADADPATLMWPTTEKLPRGSLAYHSTQSAHQAR